MSNDLDELLGNYTLPTEVETLKMPKGFIMAYHPRKLYDLMATQPVLEDKLIDSYTHMMGFLRNPNLDGPAIVLFDGEDGAIFNGHHRCASCVILYEEGTTVKLGVVQIRSHADVDYILALNNSQYKDELPPLLKDEKLLSSLRVGYDAFVPQIFGSIDNVYAETNTTLFLLQEWIENLYDAFERMGLKI